MSRIAYLSTSLFTVLAVACSSDSGTKTPDAAQIDVGFNKPAKAAHANMESSGTWTDLGAADFTCLNQPTADVARTVEVTLNTVVNDFQSGKMVTGAAVTAFAGTNPAVPFAAAVTTDSMGKLTLTLPVNANPRIGFKMVGGMSGADTQLETYLMNQYVEPSTAIQTSPELLSVSNSTGMLLPALIGENRTAGTGVIAGAFRDCQHHEVSNVIATLSTTKDTTTLVPGAASYYFSLVPLPVKHNVSDASGQNGLFMVIQLAPTPTGYVQIWGYKTDADLASDTLTMLGQLDVPVIADTVVTGSYEPLRSN